MKMMTMTQFHHKMRELKDLHRKHGMNTIEIARLQAENAAIEVQLAPYAATLAETEPPQRKQRVLRYPWIAEETILAYQDGLPHSLQDIAETISRRRGISNCQDLVNAISHSSGRLAEAGTLRKLFRGHYQLAPAVQAAPPGPEQQELRLTQPSRLGLLPSLADPRRNRSGN